MKKKAMVGALLAFVGLANPLETKDIYGEECLRLRHEKLYKYNGGLHEELEAIRERVPFNAHNLSEFLRRIFRKFKKLYCYSPF